MELIKTVIGNFKKRLMLHKIIGAAIRKLIFLSSLEGRDKRGLVLWTICKTPTFFVCFILYLCVSHGRIQYKTQTAKSTVHRESMH